MRRRAAPVSEPAPAADEPYVLPEIVPATDDAERIDDVEQQVAPTLPPRSTSPAPTLPPDTTGGRPISTERSAPPPAAAAPAAPVARPAAPASFPTAPAPTRPASAPTAPTAAGASATGWGDHMVATKPGSTTPLRAPGRRPRVRRVTRVLRHVDPWSTFKIALLFSAVGYVVVLTSGVLLWRVADSTGTLANVERWFTQFGWETFELDGSEIFHDAWIIGLFGVVAATGAAVLLVTLFNLVSDIVGGIRVTVLEEEVVERTISSTRRYVVRRSPTDVTGVATGGDWSIDDERDEPSPGRAVADDVGNGADRPTAPIPTTPSTVAAHTDDDWSVD